MNLINSQYIAGNYSDTGISIYVKWCRIVSYFNMKVIDNSVITELNHLFVSLYKGLKEIFDFLYINKYRNWIKEMTYSPSSKRLPL